MSKEQTDWVMVPREATEAMWRAAQQFHNGVWSHQVEAMWRAMLAAAPVPPEAQAGSEERRRRAVGPSEVKWPMNDPLKKYKDAATAPSSPAGGVQGVTEEMVERAAKAIYETDDTWSAAFPFDDKPEFDKNTYRTLARAALTAALSSQAQTTGGVAAPDLAREPIKVTPLKPHEFSADPYTSKCMYCGRGRGRHDEGIRAWEQQNALKSGAPDA